MPNTETGMSSLPFALKTDADDDELVLQSA